MEGEGRVEVIDLDLNEEPTEPSRNYLEMASDMESDYSIIEERIRRLEAVTLRARQRQEWRLLRESANEQPAIEEALSLAGEGVQAVASGEALNPANERRVEGLKRSDSHLLALALELDGEGPAKKNSGEAFFDCNICLRKARDPILTCCGHLYCWPCFYLLPDMGAETKECPACKGEVKDTGIIPIYGSSDKALKRDGGKSGVTIPPRPQARRIESLRQQRITRGSHSLRIEEVLRSLHSFSTLSSNLSSALSSAERIVEDLEGMAHLYPPTGHRYRVMFDTETNSNIMIPLPSEAPDANPTTDSGLPSSSTSVVAVASASAESFILPDPPASLPRRISRIFRSQAQSTRSHRRSSLSRARTELQEQLRSIVRVRTEQQAPLLEHLSRIIQSEEQPLQIDSSELLPVRVVASRASNNHGTVSAVTETNATTPAPSSRRRADVLDNSEGSGSGTSETRRRRLR